MAFTPLFDRVIIRPLPEDERTVGGIILPSTSNSPFQYGDVVAVGAGAVDGGNLVPLTVKVGDKVMFPRMTGRDVIIDGEKVMLLQEKELLGIVS